MTHQVSTRGADSAAGPGERVAQLRQMLALVEQIAGRSFAPAAAEAALDEGARIASAYGAAPTIVQRRFDAVAAETSGWALAGVEALVAAQDEAEPPRAAARVLADELGRALDAMARVLDA